MMMLLVDSHRHTSICKRCFSIVAPRLKPVGSYSCRLRTCLPGQNRACAVRLRMPQSVDVLYLAVNIILCDTCLVRLPCGACQSLHRCRTTAPKLVSQPLGVCSGAP